MKAIYTDAAKIELEAFQVRQRELLEAVVAERKLVLGDDVLEITASDIKAASERIRFHRPVHQRSRSTQLVTRAYVLVGIVLMLGSFFYSPLMELYTTNRIQATLFLTGTAMTCLGLVLGYWVQVRQKRLDEERDDYHSSLTSRELESFHAALMQKLEVMNEEQKIALTKSVLDEK